MWFINWIKRSPLVAYFALVFGIEWLLVFALVSLIPPMIALLIGSWLPNVVGIFITSVAGGRAGFRARAYACKYVTVVGLAHRAIYNSINGSILPENIEALKNSDVDAAIVLAFNPADPSVVGREKVLVEGGVAGQVKGMIPISEECGITRPILDTAATPLGLGSGSAYREILACKAIHGYPTGGAYHNMTVAWTWLKRWKGSKKNPSQLVESLKGKDVYLKQLLHHYQGGIEGVVQAAWSAPDIG